MTSNFKTILLWVVSIFVISSCVNKKNNIPEVNTAYSQFVSSYTSGVISSESPILIEFSQDTLRSEDIGIDIDEKLIALSPAVKGHVQWIDDYRLAFYPDERMKSDEVYQVSVYLDKILDVPDEYGTMTFNVKIMKQSFTVNDIALKAYGNQNIKLQYLSGVVSTADIVDDDKAEEVLKVNLLNENLKIKWVHSLNGKEHSFTVDSIERADVNENISISWNGKSIGVDNTGEEQIELPAIDVFKVVDVKVIQQPEQYLLVRFSDPLLSEQNLEGLVTIVDANDLQYQIEGNDLKVYFASRLSGERDIYISSGIKNALNYKLKESTTIRARFEDLKPAVKLVSDGTIVPSSDELVFPFEAVNLKAVELRIIKIYSNNIQQFFQQNSYNDNSDIKQVGRLILQKKIDLNVSTFSELKNWNTYRVNLSDLIKVEPGAIYRLQLRFHKEYSLYGLNDLSETNQVSVVDQLEAEQEIEEEFKEWDSPSWYSDYYYPDGYLWNQRENPEHVSYYNYNQFVSKNLFATNLAVIAKGGSDQSMNFAVTNLKTAETVSGVSVKIYNYQKQLMQTLQTGSDGLCRVGLESKPYLLVAEKDGQYAYLRLDDGSSLSLSNFDVSGDVVQKGIKGYVYGERGVWRPGDKIYVTFILEDSKDNLPENYPVILELINPSGQTVTRQVKSSGENGFYLFTTETDSDAPTGNWRAILKVGGQSFTKRIKVETVKPNRLKVDLKFDSDTIIANKETSSIRLEAQWLHGGIAKNLKAQVDLSFSKATTSFQKYFNYIFDDPTKDFYVEEEQIFEGRVDSKGVALVNYELPKISSAPGILNAHFSTRVYEESGDFSIDVNTMPYSPYTSFVGIKMPGSDSDWYKTDTSYPLDIVTVDYEGNEVDHENLEVRVYKVDWHWWWDSGEDNLARYVNSSYNVPVLKTTVSTVNGKASIPIEIKYNSWEDNGRYLIYVKDPVSGHSTGLTTYFSRWGYMATDGMQETATMLTVKSDKEKYNIGEEVTVTIPSGKKGKALISIENGTSVIDMFWVDSQEQNTTFKFKTTEEMAPNVYVHISLIQPHSQTENDAPIRLYGVIPVLVEDPNTHLNPVISMPEKLEPEADYEIAVSEEDGRKMTYTLAVVDEGLLDLTSFKTPDPWSSFYAREALGVKTWDFYNDVIGAYGARLESAFAVGGDENLDAAKRKEANRFESVVSVIGPFTVENGKTNTHKLNMPNYVGAVRVMVVAGNNGAYGNTEQSVKVSKPLMLLATLPRVLGPGEEVKLPVNVFAMNEDVKSVRVTIETNNLLESTNGNSKMVEFSEVGDQIVNFDLKVSEEIGVGKVNITAESGENIATYEIEIDVRPPNPRVVNVQNAVIEAGNTWETDINAPGMNGTNVARLEMSSIFPMDINRRLEYLIEYPHGCIEQVTSGVFPQLLLNQLIDVSDEQRYEIEDNVRIALNKYTRFQTSEGGFSYWPGGTYSHAWGTNYAGHFMLKAEEAGYSLPYGIKEKWLAYQKNEARNWKRSEQSYERSELVQAYRLYTLALAQSPDFGAMNRLREEEGLDQLSQWRLAAAYAVAGQPEVATQMIANLSKTIKPFKELSYTFGSDVRDKAMIVETLVLLNRDAEAFSLVKEIADALSSDAWMSTQTTAYSLLSIAEFSGGDKLGDDMMSVRLSVNGGSGQNISSASTVWQDELDLINNKTAEVNIENLSDEIMYASIYTEGIPVVGDSTSAQSNLYMDVWYTDMQGNKIDPSGMQQGTDFVAVVSIQNPGQKGVYKEMSLTTIFPSGWEIINNRLNDLESSLKSDAFTYQDIRDDRVLTYFDLSTNEKKTFRIQLNATYQGRFYLPSVQCEAMYDNSINSRVPGKWVEVME